jgi:excisionase family DNA binding protein
MKLEVQRRVLSIREATHTLGISRASIYRLMCQGRLPTVKIGSRRLIPVASIDDLLRGGARAAGHAVSIERYAEERVEWPDQAVTPECRQ